MKIILFFLIIVGLSGCTTNVALNFQDVKVPEGKIIGFAPLQEGVGICSQYFIGGDYCYLRAVKSAKLNVRYMLLDVRKSKSDCRKGMTANEYSACLKLDAKNSQAITDGYIHEMKSAPFDAWKSLLVNVDVGRYAWDKPRGPHGLFDWGKVVEYQFSFDKDGELKFMEALRWRTEPSNGINPWQ